MNRVPDLEGRYCEQESIFTHCRINDMTSGGVFANLEELEKEKKIRGWEGIDNRTVKIWITQEFLKGMVQFRKHYNLVI